MMTAAIAYRSPMGRVRCYDGSGRVTLALEPSTEADVTWESLAPEIRCGNAEWLDARIDKQYETSAVKAPQQEKLL